MASSQVDPTSVPEAAIRYSVKGFPEQWRVSEAEVPEAAWHERALTYLRELLVAWVAASGRDATVYRNLAVRVRAEQPRVGFDPDLCLVQPSPPDAENLDSLRLWTAGHTAPELCVEVVSPGHPTKDYVSVPARCAAAGVQELVVFDPRLSGPVSLGGPQLLQVWRRGEDGTFDRVAAGDGPARSEILGAWLVPSAQGLLRIAEDPRGARPWLTATEHEREAKEGALRRVAELERALAGQRGG